MPKFYRFLTFDTLHFLQKTGFQHQPFDFSALHSISSSSAISRIFFIIVPLFKVTEVPFTSHLGADSKTKTLTDTFDLGVATNPPRETYGGLDVSNVKHPLFHSIRIRRKIEQDHLHEEG